MTVEEYNELKSIDTESVLEKMRNTIDWMDRSDPNNEWDLYHDSYQILACFIMWKIKNMDKHDTVEDYYQYCIGDERFEVFDDVLGFLEGSEQWNSFVTKKEDFTNDELMAVVLFSSFWEGDDPVPEGVLGLADKLLDIRKGDHVIEYHANDYEFSIYSGMRHKNTDYIAYEYGYSKLGDASCRVQMMDLPQISLMTEWESLEKSNKAFINGSFYSGINPNGNELQYSLTEYEDYLETEWKSYPRGKNPIWDVCSAVFDSVEKDGRMIALIDAGQLSGKETEKTRRFLVESKCVRGVIALPEKLLRETWVNVYILIMERNSECIRFCDAREKYGKGRIKGKRINQITEEYIKEIFEDYTNGNDFSRTVTTDEVLKNESILLPQRYVITNQHKESFRFDDCIWEINRGITISAEQMDKLVTSENTGTKCIIPSCLFNGVIGKTYYFKEDEYDNKKNYAQRGDLLINKTGRPIRVAVSDGAYIVIGNTYIVKLKNSRMDPYYIKCFLESSRGQQEIEKYSVGAKTPLISVANLRKLEIPVFGSKKQRRVEQQAREITEDLQRSIREMDDMSKYFD